jgi:hypothetical protein
LTRWFKATDIPKRDNTPFKTLLDKKTPLIWQPFSKYDSDLLEQAFQNKTERILPVELDGLFEVDLTLFEISPIYWDGPIYEVRRGIWFEPKGFLD